MSTLARVHCDMCGVMLKGDWDAKQRPWARVFFGTTVQDFCVACWEPIIKVMRRNFVDGLMMEAQGFKEEAE